MISSRLIIILNQKIIRDLYREKASNYILLDAITYIIFTFNSMRRLKDILIEHSILSTSCYSHGVIIGLNTLKRN